MLRRTVGLTIALLLGLGACSSRPKATVATEPSPPGAMAPAAGTRGSKKGVSNESPTEQGAPLRSESEASAVTGSVSEQEFKALHQLKAGAAPKLKGTEIKLPGGSRAYLSLPNAAKPPVPGIVVIHEWWGLNQHIRHWADRLAADGYGALAVDLFGGKVAKTPDEAMALVKSVDEKAARATLLDAFEFLARDARILAKRRASIGWCFGGKWSLELALAAPDLDAAVIYYGHVTTDPEVLARLRTPVLAVFGKRDSSIPQEHVQSFEAALDKLGVEHAVLTYDAEHAFANPSGARYDEQAAAAAWEETRAFLAAHLKAAD